MMGKMTGLTSCYFLLQVFIYFKIKFLILEPRRQNFLLVSLIVVAEDRSHGCRA